MRGKWVELLGQCPSRSERDLDPEHRGWDSPRGKHDKPPIVTGEKAE